MATTDRPQSDFLKINENCPPDQEINILLLGQTGVGKTTFINAFTNYLIYDTLDEAIVGDMQVPIPSSFSFTDPGTFEQKTITVGNENNGERANENSQSGTEQCRSFVFPIGHRNLRLIDTPGMGDTRGSEQDNKNFFEILTYISHYEHLNGICIFLKPNEERLTISFRLCIKQVLHYLHSDASGNIIFIFTNARSTFFMPGSSKKLLQILLDEHRNNNNNVEVPFTRDNTFFLDNEPFQYLALSRNGIKINNEQIESYRKSWDHNVKEYQRLMDYISKCSLHGLADTLSLNEAEQLIRKFPRPIAETIRLIQQNIQLAKESKKELLKNQHSTPYKLPQYIVQIETLRRPKLVCFSKNCSRIVDVNGMKRIIYRNCQEKSYLNGVIQEVIRDSKIAQCKVIDNKTGKLSKLIEN
jgi:GTPase SAR1 family protein